MRFLNFLTFSIIIWIIDYFAMSDNIIRSILIDLISVVIPNDSHVDVDLPPNKKLRLAKSTDNEIQKSRAVQDPISAQIRFIQDSRQMRPPSQASSEMGPPPPGRPRYDVARKLAELQADRDHWKNLYLSSRLQVLISSDFNFFYFRQCIK